MRHRSLIFFMILSLVFLFPLFVIGLEDPIESDTSVIITLDIPATDHRFKEIDWKTEGSLIYWCMEVTGSLDFYVIDSSDYNDIEEEIWDKEAVFSTIVEIETEYDIVLPYDDTFYFVMFNRRYSSVAVDGWYARDETKPIGEMWGISTNFANEVLIGSTADLGCIFTDHFGLSEISLYENEIAVQVINVSSLIEHRWVKGNYKFTTLGDIEIRFEATDLGGNIGIASKTVEVVNEFSLPPTTTVEPFNWIGIFEDYWFVIIPVGTLLGIAIIVGLEKAGKLP